MVSTREAVPTAATGLVLMISSEAWMPRAIGSILRSEGYATLQANSAEEGLRLAARMRPDLLLVDRALADRDGFELCRRLRALRSIRASTPIVMLTSEPFTRRDEVAASESGAWALLSPPFGAREILSRVRLYIAAKRDADSALEGSFLDSSTGFYNIQGLLRRMQEFAADANRSDRPIACVAFSTASASQQDAKAVTPTPSEDMTGELGRLIQAAVRSSDAIGRVGPHDFVILAPGTDKPGAFRLAQRVIDAFDERPFKIEEQASLHLRAGLSHSSGSDILDMVPEELLRQASAALRAEPAPSGPPMANRIRAFDGN